MADLSERIDKILAKYFKDPIDTPCPYCEALKELSKLFKAEESYWREKCRNDTMSARKSGWDDAVKFYEARVGRIVKIINRFMAIHRGGIKRDEKV